MRLPLLLGALALAGCVSSSTRAGEGSAEDNAVLARAYAEDQADDERSAFIYEGGDAIPLDTLRSWVDTMPPELADDVFRMIAVDSVLAAGGARTANDFYHAAMVYQHGGGATSYRRAHELASRAVDLDPDHADAKWLTAASWDRYLAESGQPQWYGTQYSCGEDGLRRLLPVEEGRVSDEERQALGVRTLAEAREREGTECGS